MQITHGKLIEQLALLWGAQKYAMFVLISTVEFTKRFATHSRRH